MRSEVWTFLTSLGVGLVLSLVYFVLLAFIVRGLRALEPKQAVLFMTVSFPFRLALLGLAMIWLVRANGLIGALAMIPSLLASRWITHRLVQRWQR